MSMPVLFYCFWCFDLDMKKNTSMVLQTDDLLNNTICGNLALGRKSGVKTIFHLVDLGHHCQPKRHLSCVDIPWGGEKLVLNHKTQELIDQAGLSSQVTSIELKAGFYTSIEWDRTGL